MVNGMREQEGIRLDDIRDRYRALYTRDRLPSMCVAQNRGDEETNSNEVWPRVVGMGWSARWLRET